MSTGHGDVIPRNEIGGSLHGKKSSKFILQIANTERSNAFQNKVVIIVAAVCDIHKNFVMFLEDGLGDEFVAFRFHS